MVYSVERVTRSIGRWDGWFGSPCSRPYLLYRVQFFPQET